jgi:hypothetical protein
VREVACIRNDHHLGASGEVPLRGVSLVAVAEVDMNWKCSMPVALLLLGAAVAARVPDRAIGPGGQHRACRHQQAEMVLAHGDAPPWELMTPVPVPRARERS